MSSLLAVLPSLLLSFRAHQQGGTVEPGRARGAARVGYGLFKLIVFAPPLERYIATAIEALPAARTTSMAWLAAFAFVFQLYLVLSGAIDVWLGARRMVGMRVAESFGAPFRATSFTHFWQSWTPRISRHDAKDRAFFHAAVGLLMVALSVTLWRGFSLALIPWLALHLGLLGLERWRNRGLFAPLPLPVCAAFCQAVFLLSGPLLYMPSLAEAMTHLRTLYQVPAPTVYSVLLEARLTTPWPLVCLWLGGLACVALPPLRWLLSERWKGWVAAGLVAGAVSLTFLARESAPATSESPLAPVSHLAQWPLTKWFREGNRDVFVGRDGWLYRQQDLDNLTLQRPANRGAKTLTTFVEQLRKSALPVLIIPVPDKVSIYPEPILPGEYHGPVRPPSYAAAVARLKEAGAVVFDPADSFWQLKKRRSWFFQTDSHWTPAAMKEVARGAAAVIRENWPRIAVDRTPMVDVDILDHADAGDLATRLDPWAPESLWGLETAQLVALPGMEETSDSPVLVLGGTLLHIFEDPQLSFGDPEGRRQPAGFAAQLAALLGRPLAAGPAVEHLTAEAGAELAAAAAASRRLVIVLIRAGDL